MSEKPQDPQTREERNRDAIEYYRARGKAPGVAEGGGIRNAYCMNCDGVIPLEYDRSQPSSREVRTCPHCGVEIDRNVQRMFNWVEIDRVPESDLASLLPSMLIVLGVLAAIALAFFLL